MTDSITLIATASFGLEGVVKYEVAQLGFEVTQVSNGRVEFAATPADIPTANLWLRTADRVLLKVGQFTATDFDQLFDQTKALPWADVIPEDGRFPVNAKTHKSAITSARSTQGIVKKAIVDSLQQHYHLDQFPETGAEFTIEVSILKDEVLLAIDSSGAGLHKRGYRAEAGAAPLQETLAAGLVQLSFWHPDRLLLDPLCGSGTILIEAALIGRNIAPGLNRTFAAEGWPLVPAASWQQARAAAKDAITPDVELMLHGSDSDAAAIAIAKQNATLAGVGDDIHFEQKSLNDVWIDRQHGIVITNPPYGIRMSDFKQINQLYITLNKMFRKKDGWSIYVLTADRHFPSYFKRARPSRVRKLFNGPLAVRYYQYYGDKPDNQPN